jgi:hypothetical protein
MKTNAVNWFELYSSDFDRAIRFYETILKVKLQTFPESGMKMAMFPFDMEKGVGGAITQMAGCSPGAGGTIVYLNAEGDLDGVLDRTAKAGGSIIKPRTAIGEHGFIGIIKDTDGNVVGLHSMK